MPMLTSSMGMADFLHQVDPRLHIALVRFELQAALELCVQPLIGKHQWHFVDILHVLRRDDGFFRNTTEQRDLFLDVR